jgi:hypothetical protein
MGCDDKDLIQAIAPLPDGSMLVQRHRPDHSIGVATLRPSPAGKSMVPGQEFITAKRREDGAYEVVDSYVHGAQPSHGGPAQVATADFRAGWDRTFNSPGGQA